jgi:IS5 family transposase
MPDIAIPSFGYKSHTSIDKRYRLIRRWDVTDASKHDGRMLRQGLLDPANTGSGVWADSAYRSKKNEAFMQRHGFTSHVHHRKKPGKPMPAHIRRGNATKSGHRAPIEHVYSVQKGPMALMVRTIGLARAKTKIGLANMTYNFKRLVQLRRGAIV